MISENLEYTAVVWITLLLSVLVLWGPVGSNLHLCTQILIFLGNVNEIMFELLSLKLEIYVIQSAVFLPDMCDYTPIK